jgi:tetratricopeptide (TPR) repeat protein
MDQEVNWGLKHPEAEDLRFAESETEAYFGRLAKAREMSRELFESVRRRELKGRAAVLLAHAALRDALFGFIDTARQQANDAVDLSPGWDVRVMAALALAWSGDAAQASKLGDQLAAEFPGGTLMQNYWLGVIRSVVWLQAGNPMQALDALRPAAAYELADTFFPAGSAIYPAYVRGVAYLQVRDGAACMAEFQKILRHQGMMGNSPLAVLAHLGVARAYALAGDKANARKEYAALLAIWKSADAGMPLLNLAKTELAGLR